MTGGSLSIADTLWLSWTDVYGAECGMIDVCVDECGMIGVRPHEGVFEWSLSCISCYKVVARNT